MTRPRTYSWPKPAIRVAAGFGAAVAGPLGGALGGWFGGAIGASAAELVQKYAEKFGEKSGEKLLETATDSLAEKLKKPSPPLEGVYREALRLSLSDIHAQVRWDGFDDWFANWEICLADSAPLPLSSLTSDQLVLERLDGLFRLTMERLAAQGAAKQQKICHSRYSPAPYRRPSFPNSSPACPSACKKTSVPSSFNPKTIKPGGRRSSSSKTSRTPHWSASTKT